MGTRIIKMPDVGEGVAEAEIVEWHVEVGAVELGGFTVQAVQAVQDPAIFRWGAVRLVQLIGDGRWERWVGFDVGQQTAPEGVGLGHLRPGGQRSSSGSMGTQPCRQWCGSPGAEERMAVG